MEEDLTGKDPEITPEQGELEKEPEIQPEETEERPEGPTTEQLVKGLQKGYTQTRQELAEIKSAIEGLREKPEWMAQEGQMTPEGEYVPKTWEEMKVDLINTIDQREQDKIAYEQQEMANIDALIDAQLGDLHAEGKVVDKKDQEDLMKFATKHEIVDLKRAYDLREEIKQAKEQGVIEKEQIEAKAGVKQEAGAKIGTSQKATTEKVEGADYKEVRTKSLQDMADEAKE